MKRRNFINASVAAGLSLTAGAAPSDTDPMKTMNCRYTFSMEDNRASLYTRAKVTPTKVFHITDTHLSLDDARGVPFQEFSKRMAAAYKSNTHFETGETCSAEDSFERTLDTAKKENVDFLAFTGDIFSFPSEAAVEWARKKLDETGIPFAYVAGNHDWHYEGMKGSAQELRATWTMEHLAPMYQGNSPLYAAYDLNGMRFVCIDNSTYEICRNNWIFQGATCSGLLSCCSV